MVSTVSMVVRFVVLIAGCMVVVRAIFVVVVEVLVVYAIVGGGCFRF